ncbi:hypothetical protein E2C01_073008 [Portunus trituberculatus]|uniref:Uncharacterized protein n=1 Tax=Portunus trituberculatus TaxID=210409 RepID=A0A5B7I1M8_PORTR|nr:hypothetical protein [Portunus trituberculatus]
MSVPDRGSVGRDARIEVKRWAGYAR